MGLDSKENRTAMLTIAPSRFFPSPSFSWRLLFETTTEFPLREIHNITVQLLCWRGLKHPNVQVANSLLLLCKRLPTPTPKVGGIAPPFLMYHHLHYPGCKTGRILPDRNQSGAGPSSCKILQILVYIHKYEDFKPYDPKTYIFLASAISTNLDL